MNPYTALLAGPKLLAPYLVAAAEERRVVELARMSLDVIVSYKLWKKPMPAWVRAMMIHFGRQLKDEWPHARQIDALAGSISTRQRCFRFSSDDTWVAVRLAAIGEAVMPLDLCATEATQAMCVALHEARLVDALRALFCVRVVEVGRVRPQAKMIALAQEQATRYLTHLIPLAEQPSASWEWHLLCASHARRQN